MALGYVEAFKALGYKITSPRNEVSSEKENGIAISIIRSELEPVTNVANVKLRFDTKAVPNWDAERMNLPRNLVRIKHLSRAQDEFGGKVDVVLWDGKEAEPWAIKRGGEWIIKYLDRDTGHHCVELIVK